MEKKKLLEIRNLHVQYKTDEAIVHAVNGVDLCVDEGETLGLVGETGAGKTTTALTIMGLLPERVGQVTEGELYLNGVDVIHAPEGQLKMMRGATASMIFQDPMTSLNPVIPVGDQILEVLELHKKDKMSHSEMEARVDQILEMVGIPAARKTEYPHQFSGGMKQRVVIAIALACEPLLLLADEPTTALDVTIQAQVLEMMRTLKKELNTAMVLITHDLGVVARICDRVGIMYAGEVVEIGTVEDIYTGEKHHPYTTGLFGAIPDLTKKTRRLNPIDGLMPDPTRLPSGCKFHDRCPHCMEICKTAPPQDITEGSHTIKCHLYDKEVQK